MLINTADNIDRIIPIYNEIMKTSWRRLHQHYTYNIEKVTDRDNKQTEIIPVKERKKQCNSATKFRHLIGNTVFRSERQNPSSCRHITRRSCGRRKITSAFCPHRHICDDHVGTPPEGNLCRNTARR